MTAPTPKSIEDCWNRIGVWGTEEPRCPLLEDCNHCFNCTVYSQAGRKLLDRPFPANYRNEWAAALVEPVQTRSLSRTALHFVLGGEEFALPTASCDEVVELGEIHSIPHRRHGFVRGVVNIRGHLEICVDLGAILGTPPGAGRVEGPPRLLVISNGTRPVAFEAQRVLGALRYDPEALHTPHVSLERASQNLHRGLIELEERRIALLDPDGLVEAVERALR